MADKVIKEAGLTIQVAPEEIMSTSISKYSDSYSYASIYIKRAKNEYITVSVEWKDPDIPAIVLDLMSFMTSKAALIEEAKKNNAEDLKEFSSIDRVKK